MWIGRTLKEKYLLLDLLGEGGMGSVYRARRQDIGDVVAVKLLHNKYAADWTAAERFRREAQAAAMVRHPNVVAIYDLYAKTAADSPAFIVMELLEGTSLRSILEKEGKLNLERALALIHEACAGVAAAHRRNILHRDLKPENLIVQPQGADREREVVKVVDFGIAKLRDLPHGQTLTETHTRIGTPLYMSPEQLQGGPLDAATDVYNLGLILYEMLAGVRPSSAASLEQLLIDRLTNEPTPLTKYASVPASVDQVVMRALARDPNQRQGNASEFARELRLAQSLITTQKLTSIQPSSHVKLRQAATDFGVQGTADEKLPSAGTSSPVVSPLEFQRVSRTIKAKPSSSPAGVSLTETNEVTDTREVIEAERVLRFWHVVEHLVPFNLRRATSNTKYEIVNREDDQRLAWINAGVLASLKMNLGQPYRYTVYLGAFSVAEANQKLRQLFGGIEPPFRERVIEESCFARFEVNEQGRPQVGSLSLTHFPWAVGYLSDDTLRASLNDSDWIEAFDSYTTAVRREFNEYEEFLNIHDYKLDSAGLSLLLGGMFEHSGWQPEYLRALARYVITEAEPEDDASLGSRTTVAAGITTEQISESDDKEEQLAESELLNSLFVDELRRVGDAVSRGDVGEALKSYLSGQRHANRVDFLGESGHEELKSWLSPQRLPLGRWPSDDAKTLSLTQQAAINIAAAKLSETPLFSVNGPPGTGKTTLLRDLIASIVVDRAMHLAEFERPSAAFEKVGTVTYLVDGKTFPIFKPDERITGFEIVVASSNNGAVENVTREIPSRSAIHESYHSTATYFTRVARRISGPNGEEPWGLMAAVLGNMRNRRAFARRFWAYDTDNALDGESAKNALSMSGHLFTKSNPVDDLSRWREAKERFMEARQLVTDLLKARGKYAVAAALESSLRQNRDAARTAAENAAKHLEEASRAEQEAEHELNDARSSFKDCVDNVESIARGKPFGLLIALSYLVKINKVRRYNEKIAKAQKALEEASARLEEWKKQYKQAAEQRKESVELCRQTALAQGEAESEFDSNDEICRRGRAELGDAFGDDKWWAHSEEQIQERTPWVDATLSRRRTELFLCALDLHEAFITAARNQIRFNLSVWSDKALGKPLSFSNTETQLRCLWQTFFLVVPVVSTTFAAVGRMFHDIKREAFGWMMIDEAGQAAPQAAVGALWRAQRAVVVGDPLQIEPVFTVEDGVADYLLNHFRLTRHWCPPTSLRRGQSAQELADHVNRFGASIRLEENSESNADRWIGCPLRVHRRCLTPMFELANLIAYNGRMINATDRIVNESNFPLGESCWEDVGGVCTEKHWNPAQGKKVVKMLTSTITNSQSLPDVYIISPFRNVKFKLKELLRARLFKLMPRDKHEQVQDWIEKSIGTVHTFQGKEASCVIFVLGADRSSSGRDAAKWAARKPNILNVAATRAKDRFYIVGDKGLWGQLPYFEDARKLLE